MRGSYDGRRDDSSRRDRDRRGGGPSRRDHNGAGSNNNTGRDGRPRKTQQELDAEMEDYWGGGNAGQEGSSGGNAGFGVGDAGGIGDAVMPPQAQGEPANGQQPLVDNDDMMIE